MTKKMSETWKIVLPLLYLFVGSLVYFSSFPTKENVFVSYLLTAGIVACIVCVFTYTHTSIKKVKDPVLWPVMTSMALLLVPLIGMSIKMLFDLPQQGIVVWGK